MHFADYSTKGAVWYAYMGSLLHTTFLTLLIKTVLHTICNVNSYSCITHSHLLHLHSVSVTILVSPSVTCTRMMLSDLSSVTDFKARCSFLHCLCVFAL
jgi:hypothetical protein